MGRPNKEIKIAEQWIGEDYEETASTLKPILDYIAWLEGSLQYERTKYWCESCEDWHFEKDLTGVVY